MKSNFKRNTANFFGALGYLFCSVQWLATILIYFEVIKDFLTSFVPKSSHENVIVHPTVAVPGGDTNVLLVVGALAITVVMVVLSIYVSIKTPVAIVKSGKKVVHEVSEVVAPVILHAQHMPVTEKNHKRITLQITVIVKLLIVIIPVILAFVSQFAPKQSLDFAIAVYASLGLASLSAIFFVLQYFLANVLSVKRQNLW